MFGQKLIANVIGGWGKWFLVFRNQLELKQIYFIFSDTVSIVFESIIVYRGFSKLGEPRPEHTGHLATLDTRPSTLDHINLTCAQISILVLVVRKVRVRVPRVVQVQYKYFKCKYDLVKIMNKCIVTIISFSVFI